MRNGELVNVKDLTVHFPVFGGVLSKRVATVKAVDGVSFSIGKKETVGLVGESGCGKTTVGRAMINILRHVAPDVEIGGSIEYHFDDRIVDFSKLHPSGNLGSQLKTVEDLMFTGNKIPFINENQKMKKALLKIGPNLKNNKLLIYFYKARALKKLGLNSIN